jgi:hypothetical protein
VAQLEDVPEQHQPLDPRDGLEQRRAELLASEQVGAAEATEVEVGDD